MEGLKMRPFLMMIVLFWLSPSCFANEVCSVGDNYYGQLGLGDSERDELQPMLMMGPAIIPASFSSLSYIGVATGDGHTLVLSNTSVVYSTGNNNFGQLGLGDETNRRTPTLIAKGALSSVSITAISAGEHHSLMLSNTGRVYSTGWNYNGQLGLGDNMDRCTPTLITAGALSTVSITAVSAGDVHSLMLSNVGRVYGTGVNHPYGGLGLGDSTDRWTPTLITAGGLSSVVVTAISAGNLHSLMLSSSGRAFGFGSNSNGELGLGNTTHRWTPTLIKAGGLSSISITAISAGLWHSLMLSDAGFVYAAGWNAFGELGLGNQTNRCTPTLMTAGGLSSVSVTAISAGGTQSFMMSNDTRTYATGDNYSGQLGLGDRYDRWTPTLITSVSTITKISSKSFFTIILASQGCQLRTPGKTTNYLWVIGVFVAAVVVVGAALFIVWRRRRVAKPKAPSSLLDSSNSDGYKL